MRHVLMLSLAIAAGASFAQLTNIGPFSGAYSEGFEGFPNYANGGFYTSMTIMGGEAVLDTRQNGQFAVYDPNVAGFGLGSKGQATVNSGSQANGQDYGPNLSWEISFDQPVMQFGGYWNYAYQQGWDDSFDLFFYDAGFNLIGTRTVSDPQVNSMIWHGWSSTVAIKQIVIDGDYVVMDDLQADLVPEPATLAAIGLGLAALARRRRS